MLEGHLVTNLCIKLKFKVKICNFCLAPFPLKSWCSFIQPYRQTAGQTELRNYYIDDSTNVLKNVFCPLQCAPSRRHYAVPGDPVFSLDIAVTVVLEKLFQGTLFFISLHIGGQFITRAAHLHRNCSGYVK